MRIIEDDTHLSDVCRCKKKHVMDFKERELHMLLKAAFTKLEDQETIIKDVKSFLTDTMLILEKK